MNKKNQKRSYVAPELTETICFVPEKGFANSEVKTNHLRQILARNSNCLRRLQKAFQQMLFSQGLQLKQC